MPAVHSYPYAEDGFDPAMPVVTIQVITPETQRRSTTLTVLVDSGSDGTTIPVEILDEIGALSIGTAIMSGIWGTRRQVNVYLVHIEIGSHLLPAVRIAGVPAGTGGILGRDVLNQLSVHLNGPANMVEIRAFD
jgi:predicted aspartyl protease